jgi:hypothetical protein
MIAGEEVLPYAFKRVTLDREEDALNLAGLQEEFFAPVMLMVRVPTPNAVHSDVPLPLMRLGPSMIPPVSLGDSSKESSKQQSVPEASRKVLDLAENFLEQMPRFADRYLHGNLACSIYVPDSIESAMPRVVETCLDDLRYGAIVVNNGALVAYSNELGCWGGYMSPEVNRRNCVSGIGKIHNFAQVDNLQKQVTAFSWGSTIENVSLSELPDAIVRPLAGLVSCGMRGVWDAITP